MNSDRCADGVNTTVASVTLRRQVRYKPCKTSLSENTDGTAQLVYVIKVRFIGGGGGAGFVSPGLDDRDGGGGGGAFRAPAVGVSILLCDAIGDTEAFVRGRS